MTIITTQSRITYAGDNVSVLFPIPFEFFLNSDITAVKTAVGGVQTTLTQGIDYSLSGAGVVGGGSATKTTALLFGETLAIFLNPPIEQESHYPSNSPFPAATLENDIDRQTQISQRLQDQINRSVRAPDGDANPSMLLPPAALRAMQYSAFDGAGNAIVVPSLPAPSGVSPILINQVPTNQQFANAGAQIQRLNDRVMVGDACINDGNFPNTVKDWLSTFQIAQPGGVPNGTLIGVQMAVLGNHLVPGLGAFLAGSEALNCTPAASVCITASFFGINNPSNPAVPAQTWTIYGEAHRMNNTTNTAVAMELDIVERGASIQFQPYSTGAVGTIGVIMAAGAGLATTGQFNATAAYVIGANPMAFNKGIVFQAKSIAGTDGVTGSGYAIAMAKGHIVSWWAAGGVQTGTIVGTGTTFANAVSLQLGEAFFSVAIAGLVHTTFNGNPAAVNSLNIFNSSTGVPVTLQAVGSDTNVDLALLNQGTGLVKFGSTQHFTANGAIATTMTSLGPTGSHTTVQEWLTIKNASSGAVRYIPCY